VVRVDAVFVSVAAIPSGVVLATLVFVSVMLVIVCMIGVSVIGHQRGSG